MSVPTEEMLQFGLPGLVDANPQTLGWVWTGNAAMTAEDEEALNVYMYSMGYGGPQKIDPFSKCGRYNKRYTTYQNLVEGTQATGGAGSDAYQQQHVDPEGFGVNFATQSIWYTDSVTGESMKGVPPNLGAYYDKDMGGGYTDAYSGPRPDSLAEEILGDSEYIFSAVHGWYEVK